MTATGAVAGEGPRRRRLPAEEPMKLKNFSNAYFVVSVLVPGFIYSGVMSAFVPTRAHKEKELI
ncbi:MAG TPA: hypothetical protein VND19_20210 [Acetobacteraceae bacterium]|nr:hypothetical protein [Acetobacteraceae bacterium]